MAYTFKLNRLYNTQQQYRGFNILITKMCSKKCQTLKSLLLSKPSIKDANGVLLQCMYALTYFEEIGLQHNDLHLDNIFVENNPSNMSLSFSDKLTFNFSCNYVVKIYDFDFSSIVPTKYNFNTYYPNRRINKNIEIKFCLSNKTNRGKRDTAQFLLNFKRYYQVPLLEYFISLCLPLSLSTARNPTLEDKLVINRDNPSLHIFKNKNVLPHRGHPCKVYDGTKFELYKEIVSARSIMNYLSPINITYIPLHNTKEDLNLMQPVLPSLAKKCIDYTSMTQCLSPKTNLSSENKQKFKQSILKVTKSLL